MKFDNLIVSILKENSSEVNSQSEIEKRFEELYERFNFIPKSVEEAEDQGYARLTTSTESDIFFKHKNDVFKNLSIQKDDSNNSIEFFATFRDESVNEFYSLLFFEDENRNPINEIRMTVIYDREKTKKLDYNTVTEYVGYSYDSGNYYQYWDVQTKDNKSLKLYTNPFWWDDPKVKKRAERIGLDIEHISNSEEY